MATLNSNLTDLMIVHKECIKEENHDYLNKNHDYSLINLPYDYSNTNKFTVLHQNIWGITNKIDEFLNSLRSNAPQVICLTEHHMKTEEIANVNLEQYTLGTAFCRQTISRGVYVFTYPRIFPLTLST